MSASTDISQMLARLGQMRQRGLAAAARGMEKAAAMVAGNSAQLCPVDTGALAASATWTDADTRGDTIEVTVGHNVNYAAAVHELYQAGGGEESKGNFKARRTRNKAAGKKTGKRNAQGQGKFLETAVRNAAPQIPAFVADEVKKALG